MLACGEDHLQDLVLSPCGCQAGQQVPVPADLLRPAPFLVQFSGAGWWEHRGLRDGRGRQVFLRVGALCHEQVAWVSIMQVVKSEGLMGAI